MFGAPGPIVINKSLYRKLAFDPDTLVPVSVVVRHTNMLAVHPRLAIESVQGLIAFAKANPGRINYATQGVGSISHITSEMFQSMTGVRMVHVPYKGAAAAIADLLGGQVDMGFLELSVVLPQVRA
ncbi:MAG: tripartite tricarboxylate transporter substrate binding protein, partial [Betaproteobacteria bacterium]|nr:tripartite tricarboxylate transporter substrate binding protein [Betaproteobacteria bacterium]